MCIDKSVISFIFSTLKSSIGCFNHMLKIQEPNKIIDIAHLTPKITLHESI